MAVLLEDDLSGDGILNFSGSSVDHVRTNITTMPPQADIFDATTPREVLRVGWFALAGTYSEGTEGLLTYCFAKQWIDFETQMFVFGYQGIAAEHVRFRIYPGGVVHIIISS